MREMHDIVQPYQCVNCLKRYCDYEGLKRHRTTTSFTNQGGYCGDTIIDSSDTYMHDESVFHCVFCSKPFFSKSSSSATHKKIA